jgi:AraC-like DNA-binding protein
MRVAPHNAPGQTDPAIFVICSAYDSGASAATAGYRQWGMGITLNGSCHYRHGNTETILESGDITLALPETPIAWRVPDEHSWNVLYAMFYPRPHWHRWLNAFDFNEGLACVKISDPQTHADVKHGLKDLLRSYNQTVAHRDEWTLLTLERVLLTLYSFHVSEKTALDTRVREAMQFMHEHYPEPLTNHQVAQAAHSSISHLTFLFKQQMNIAPMQYLEQLRLQRATEMLQFSTADVKEVMVACGYHDAAYFSNRFRRYSGRCPSSFRTPQRSRHKSTTPA